MDSSFVFQPQVSRTLSVGLVLALTLQLQLQVAIGRADPLPQPWPHSPSGFDSGVHSMLDQHQGHYDDSHHDHGHQDDGPASGNANLNQANCRLPTQWKGKWFQSGFPSPLTIDDRSIAHKGVCLERSGSDKFLFYEASNNCHRCVVIIEHHRNVLQYKESQYCEDKDDLDNLCSQIPGDASLYSLFRMDAQPIDCPFKGAPFTFTYNRGHGECRDPVSHVDTCTDNSRILLRFQACPNVQKTESTSEELECLATWRDGSNHYLIGKIYNRIAIGSNEISNEERYRCFVFEPMKNHSDVDPVTGHFRTIGYKVAQSGDASCTGVTSTDTGARALTITKVEHGPVAKCKFPQWVGSHHWHTLDSRLSVKLHKGSVLNVQEEARKNNTLQLHYTHYAVEPPSPLLHFGATGARLGFGSPSMSPSQLLFRSGSRITCQTRLESSDDQFLAVASYTEGCKRESVCLRVYKRHNHVIEMQLQKQSSHEENDCTRPVYADEVDSVSYVTLISSSTPSTRCPNLGKYMASGVTAQDGRVVRDAACGGGSQGAAFSTLVVGCGDKGTMEFHSKCASEEPISSYTCHGSWEEGGTKYLIASPMSRSSNSARRYCFIYTQTDDGGLRVSSSSESCRKNISAGVGGSWAFNLTVDGQCAERLTSSGAAANGRSFGGVGVGSQNLIAHYCKLISVIFATTTLMSSSVFSIRLASQS